MKNSELFDILRAQGKRDFQVTAMAFSNVLDVVAMENLREPKSLG